MNALTQISVRMGEDGGAPNPSPVAPPGAEGFELVLSWVMWIALGAGVLGFMIVGIMMMLSNSGRMQSGGEHAKSLGWVAVGCVIVGAASLLVNQFL